MVDIPIICACQITDPWRHKSDLWRHRCDTASSMSTIRPKYSTEMHQNTSFCTELNGEHAGEGPMVPLPLPLKVPPTIDSFADMDSWSWKSIEFPKISPLTCHNWVKYWPRTKNNTFNREYSARAICWSFPLSSTTLRLETPRGVAPPPHPPVRPKVAKHRIRARFNGRLNADST